MPRCRGKASTQYYDKGGVKTALDAVLVHISHHFQRRKTDAILASLTSFLSYKFKELMYLDSTGEVEGLAGCVRTCQVQELTETGGCWVAALAGFIH